MKESELSKGDKRSLVLEAAVCVRRSADSSRGKLPTVPQTKAARSWGLRGKKRDLQ